MNILITGIGGFVGGHLLAHLNQTPDVVCHGTVISEAEKRPALVAMCPRLWTIDLRDPKAVTEVIATVKPDRVFHLAGQAFVPASFDDPWDTLENNIRGTLNILQAVLQLKLQTRILVITSADIYGPVQPDQLPLREDRMFLPSSPYSVSKIAQDMLAQQYAISHNMFTVRARPFNHIGPGQNNRFAVPNWASQIAEIEAGQREPFIAVGTLTAARDFTDVRDVVKAYDLMLTNGSGGSVYNVCSGKAFSMQSILDTLLSMSKVRIEIRVDKDRLRPVETPILVGDYSRLREQTGWQPHLSIEQSLRDVLDEWRQRVSSNANIPTPRQ